MAKYRKIDPRIWNDAKFRELSDNGKLVFLFVLTHPYLTSLGCMRATLDGLAAELSWTPKAFREAFQEASTRGLLRADEAACFVSAPKFLRYNIPESPNVVRGWINAWDLIPECDAKSLLYKELKAFVEGFGEPFAKAFGEAFAKAMPNQEQEQEYSSVAKATAIEVQEVFDLWNETALPESGGLKAAKKLTQERRRKILARLKNPDWLLAFKEATQKLPLPSSPGRDWQPDFDWMVHNESNVFRVLEGKYDWRASQNSTPSDSVHSPRPKARNFLAERRPPQSLQEVQP